MVHHKKINCAKRLDTYYDSRSLHLDMTTVILYPPHSFDIHVRKRLYVAVTTGGLL
jgi:hypothetical protein